MSLLLIRSSFVQSLINRGNPIFESFISTKSPRLRTHDSDPRNKEELSFLFLELHLSILYFSTWGFVVWCHVSFDYLRYLYCVRISCRSLNNYSDSLWHYNDEDCHLWFFFVVGIFLLVQVLHFCTDIFKL